MVLCYQRAVQWFGVHLGAAQMWSYRLQYSTLTMDSNSLAQGVSASTCSLQWLVNSPFIIINSGTNHYPPRINLKHSWCILTVQKGNLESRCFIQMRSPQLMVSPVMSKLLVHHHSCLRLSTTTIDISPPPYPEQIRFQFSINHHLTTTINHHALKIVSNHEQPLFTITCLVGGK